MEEMIFYARIPKESEISTEEIKADLLSDIACDEILSDEIAYGGYGIEIPMELFDDEEALPKAQLKLAE